jgi:hypothetical protein
VEIDLAHVMDRHHPSGRVAGNREAARQGAVQRGQGYETNDVWPAEFSAERIERIVRRAYRNADARVGHDARSGYTLLQGSANGFRVEFWIDFRTGNVRTAYPIGPG